MHLQHRDLWMKFQAEDDRIFYAIIKIIKPSTENGVEKIYDMYKCVQLTI